MSTYDVVIVTGWSAMGGSTESYINLTNLLNANDIKTVLVGRHDYHLSRCNGLQLDSLNELDTNNIIWHFLKGINISNTIFENTNTILSCHETRYNTIFEKYKDGIDAGFFNYIHFVSDWQMDWHLAGAGRERSDNMCIIPNILDPALRTPHIPPNIKVGGVIGSIDRCKLTHISIEKALADGCDIVRVFGSNNSDLDYYREHIIDLLKHPKVIYHGTVNDKNKMYNSITDVYHYSSNETWGYIQAECEFLNIPFHTHLVNNINSVSNDNILELWKEILK